MAIGFGILGAGMISSLHADAMKNSRKARLVAVCDLQRQRAEKLVRDFAPEAKVYTGLDALLADPMVDVVDVVTPNALHTDAVLAAARAGKHVLCEKPPAMSLRDTDRMTEACRQANRKLGIFVQSRLRGTGPAHETRTTPGAVRPPAPRRRRDEVVPQHGVLPGRRMAARSP